MNDLGEEAGFGRLGFSGGELIIIQRLRAFSQSGKVVQGSLVWICGAKGRKRRVPVGHESETHAVGSNGSAALAGTVLGLPEIVGVQGQPDAGTGVTA